MIYRVENTYTDKIGHFGNSNEYEDTGQGLDAALKEFHGLVDRNVETAREYSDFPWDVWLTYDEPENKWEGRCVPRGKLLAHATSSAPPQEYDCKHFDKADDYKIKVETEEGRVEARGTPEFCKKWVTNVEM